MTAQLVRLDDYRPPVPGIASLYLSAWLRVWSGLAMLSAIPVIMFIRGRR